MANPGDIRAGEAFVEIYAEDKRLVTALNKASTRLKAWGQSVTALGRRMLTAGLAGTAAFFAAGKVFSDVGDSLQKMSIRTGISVESLSELAFAADSSGTSLETLESAVRIMQRNLAQGSDATRNTLNELGISLDALQQADPEAQLKAIADGIARISDPAKKTAVAMELFGKSGAQLLPLFEDGAAGIEALQRQARHLGLTMSTQDANAAAALNDALGALTSTAKRAVTIIGAAVAPAFRGLAEWITNALGSLVKFANANREIINLALMVAGGMAATGASFGVIGLLMRGLGVALGAVATAISGIGTVIKTVLAAALSTVASLFAFLLTPAGALLAALGGIVAYAIYVTEAWKPVLTWLADTFKWVSQVAVQAWQGISDALAAGDLALAAEVAFAALKTVWYEALAWMTQKWIDFKVALITAWHSVVYGIAQMLLTGVAAVKTIWFNLQAAFRTAWVKTAKFIGDTWDRLYFWLARSFTNLTHLFSSAAEAAAARRALDEEQARRAQERERKAQADLARIESERKQRVSATDAGLMDSLNALEEDRRRALAEAIDAQRGGADELRRKADEARKKFDDATKKAKAAREEAERNLNAPAAPAAPQPIDLEDIDLEDIDRALATAKKQTSVIGTFSGFAAARLGSSNAVERTARATEETAKNTKKLTQILQPNAFV